MKNYTTAAFIAVALFSTPVDAATLVLNGDGLLAGADGVTVEGVDYDVRFSTLTCAEAFEGCNEVSDFPFDLAGANSASQALLDQVFIGIYDDDSALTLVNRPSDDLNIVRTPVALTGRYASITFNFGLNGPIPDEVTSYNGPQLSELFDGEMWARWTIAGTPFAPIDVPISNVPLPASALLLLSAIGTLVRRPKQG